MPSLPPALKQSLLFMFLLYAIAALSAFALICQILILLWRADWFDDQLFDWFATTGVNIFWVLLFVLFILMLLVADHLEGQATTTHNQARNGGDGAETGSGAAQDGREARSFLVSAALLVPVTIFFFYIFSFPTIRPKIDLDSSFAAEVAEPVSDSVLTLITTEHHNAMEEIRLRIEHDDEWFHIKFLLIGGLFTLVGSLVVVERIELATKDTSRLGIEHFIARPAGSSILAIVLIVAITIDMHVRTSYLVVHQLANWIMSNVDANLNCEKSIFSSYCNSSAYVSWEQFLRLSSGSLKGMHEDFLWSMFQTPHIHFSTWALYVLYISAVFWLASSPASAARLASSPASPPSAAISPSENAIVVLLFVIVHVALGAFAFIGHSAPASFYEKVIMPIPGYWISGQDAGYIFVLVWIIMTGLVVSRMLVIFPKMRASTSRIVSAYALFVYVLALIYLAVSICGHTFKIDPKKTRGGLGQFIVKQNDTWHKVSLILEAPEGFLARLKEHGVVDAVQDKLIDSSYEAGQKPSCEDANLDAVEFGIEPDIIKERAQNKKGEWCHDKKLDCIVKQVAKSTGLASDTDDNTEIRVFVKDLGYDKEEQYELPEFVVADLNKNGRNVIKVKFIVVSSSVNVWRIKKKEAKVVDSVLRLLHDLTPEKITSRDELRCKVRNEIIAALSQKSSPETCNIPYEGSANQMVKEVLVKELVLYEPPIVHELGVSEEERRK